MTYNPGKYKAIPIVINGIRFASKVESQRYAWLLANLTSAQKMTLVVHPPFPIHVNDIKVGKYIGDFYYAKEGEAIIEDVKGWKVTDLFAFKKRCILAQYGIRIREVRLTKGEWITK